jgi:hypothetical protein
MTAFERFWSGSSPKSGWVISLSKVMRDSSTIDCCSIGDGTGSAQAATNKSRAPARILRATDIILISLSAVSFLRITRDSEIDSDRNHGNSAARCRSSAMLNAIPSRSAAD